MRALAPKGSVGVLHLIQHAWEQATMHFNTVDDYYGAPEGAALARAGCQQQCSARITLGKCVGIHRRLDHTHHMLNGQGGLEITARPHEKHVNWYAAQATQKEPFLNCS